MQTARQILILIAWLGVSFIPALFGSGFMPGEWYGQLRKPAWTPPGYIFGPVWTLLYTTMGVAAWMVWKRTGFQNAKFALSIFLIQLVLNGLWSWIFFGLHKPGLALGEIILLWAAIIITVISFWSHYKPAGVLLLPYLTWVSFAAFLNFSIWRLNVGQ